MDRKEFFAWLETCPKTCEWDIVEIENDYCRIFFPIDVDNEEEE